MPTDLNRLKDLLERAINNPSGRVSLNSDDARALLPFVNAALAASSNPSEKLYSTNELGAMLQMDPSTVSKWIDKGLLTAFRTPGGHRRVKGKDIVSFCAKFEMPVPAELKV